VDEAWSVANGPSWRGPAVDRLHDRVLGRPTEPHHRLALPDGSVVDRP